MSTVQIKLKRDWFDPQGVRRRAAQNPHTVSKAWWDEEKVPGDAVLVPEAGAPEAPKPVNPKPYRPLDAGEGTTVGDANVGVADKLMAKLAADEAAAEAARVNAAKADDARVEAAKADDARVEAAKAAEKAAAKVAASAKPASKKKGS